MKELCEAELLEVVTLELRDLREAGAGMPFVFEPVEAFTLMAVLQLALRHPGLNGYVEAFARNLAQNIEQRLSIQPGLKEAARRGWDQKYDPPSNWGPKER
jgi:hypothetical protein